ncbi:hypothetical protein DFH06DRAFT_1251492 [Mycena polygramma]|nr:hypothetical protein DFH06DRAFT_1251492 [Mycena polygramma]
MSSAAPWAFPLELLLETASHHRDYYDFLSPLTHYDDVEERRVSRKALRSLSQTCSALRSVCLPLLWERFDVPFSKFKYRNSQDETDEDSAVAPHIFPYIKSVHISFEEWADCFLDPLFPLVDFLCRLANLTSLRIFNLPDVQQTVSNISYAFALSRFPTVTSLFLPYDLIGAFDSFPNAKTFASPEIFSNRGTDTPPFSDIVKQSFPHLTALAGLWIDQGEKEFVDELACKLPRLRALSVASPFKSKTKSLLELLEAFTHLSELAVVYHGGQGFLPLKELIEGCKKILLRSQSSEPKVLKVWSDRARQERVVHMEQW